MSSSEQDRIHEVVQTNPPHPEAELVGWVLVAEWEVASRERLLSRLWSVNTSSWQVKGYLHEGLFGAWPEAGLNRQEKGWGNPPS